MTRAASETVVWNGRRDGPNRGLLLLAADVPRAAPPLPSDEDEPTRPVRRGRPPRAGERARARIELRLTLAEARAFNALATANGTTVADMIRLAVADFAADAGRQEPVILGRAVLDCVR